MRVALYLSFALSLIAVGCVEETEVTPIGAECASIEDSSDRNACYAESGVRLTVIHTSDWHSRILPYDMDVLATDERLGLLQENEPFGGIARAAYAIKRIRDNAEHVIHVDSGDCFQGAPIFNEFLGDPEIEAMNHLNIDAFVIGNHEFDNGNLNVYDKFSDAQFPVLAANYFWRPAEGNEAAPITNIAKPYTVIDANGIKIGVIGMANFSSLSSISYGDSGLGITVGDNVQMVQSYVNLLRPNVNIIVVLTHLGLGEDEQVIRNTSGIDVLFGGHLHVVLNPPKVIPDLDGRLVPLVHSGAFLKYLGRFDGVFAATIPDEPHNYELVTHDYAPIPIDSRLPEDPQIAMLMAPYESELARRIDVRKVIGYTPQPLRRFGTSGGDSPLGNFLADTMLERQRVEADISATNSLGIRADINRGEITLDQMYNVFPFPNTITTMTLSGNEVQELFDYNTYRSAGRGCATQLQVAGIEYDLDCDTVNKEVNAVLDSGEVFEFEYRDPDAHFAKNIRIQRGACHSVDDCRIPAISVCEDNDGRTCNVAEGEDVGTCLCREELQDTFYYKFATNNYMARGGSGFRTLRFNTTQSDTGVDLRDAVVRSIEGSPSCEARCEESMGENYDPARPGSCAVLTMCRDDLTTYESRWCEQLDPFSEQDYCLEDVGAASCIAANTMSEKELCYLSAYPECDELYYSDEITACAEALDATQQLCASANATNDKEACVASNAPQCADLNPVSERGACLDYARLRAESLCPGLPCPSAQTNNRQRPIRPRNDGGAGGGSPITIMQGLQDAGHDACPHF